jgi:hypothetical protein
MAKFDVDGPNRLLIAKVGITAVDVKVDLYSDAKEHWIATADMKYPFPFRTVGGDPIGGGKFFGDGYFLTNGWKIRPHEADHELVFDGNLYLDSGESPGIVIPTVGDFVVLSIIERSSDAIGINTGGTIAPTQQEIRDALKIAPSAGASAAGSVDDKLDTLAIPPSVHLSVAYDDVATTLDLVSWLTRGNNIVASPTALSIVWRNPSGTTLFSLTQADATLLSTGHYVINNYVQPLNADTSYQVAVTITDATGSVTTQRSVVTT